MLRTGEMSDFQGVLSIDCGTPKPRLRFFAGRSGNRYGNRREI